MNNRPPLNGLQPRTMQEVYRSQVDYLVHYRRPGFTKRHPWAFPIIGALVAMVVVATVAFSRNP